MEKQIGLLNLLDKNILYVIGGEFWNWRNLICLQTITRLETGNLRVAALVTLYGHAIMESGMSQNCVQCSEKNDKKKVKIIERKKKINNEKDRNQRLTYIEARDSWLTRLGNGSCSVSWLLCDVAMGYMETLRDYECKTRNDITEDGVTGIGVPNESSFVLLH